MTVARDAAGLVGGTPLVELSRLAPKPGVRILAKCEFTNPTGSVKDRIAVAMLDAAEQDGSLQPGGHILEPSSGNTGIALAALARLRGYRLTVVIPENVSVERRQLLTAFGAEVVLSPGDRGSNGAIDRAMELQAGGDQVVLFQYGNPANIAAHYDGTGAEIVKALGGQHVDAFVAGLGTGGTLMGVGRRLKGEYPDCKVVAVEPPVGDLVQGLRSLDEGYIPPILDPHALDGKVLVGTYDSLVMTRRLLLEEGIFAGVSSGAAVHGAVRWAERLDEGIVVTLLPDAGWKYLSTGAYTGDLEATTETLSRMLYF